MKVDGDIERDNKYSKRDCVRSTEVLKMSAEERNTKEEDI